MHFTEETAPETIEFNGVTYRRMGGKRRYYLSQSKTNAGRRRAKGLHVAVWEFYSGETVPAGHEVHHRDANTFNLSYENLECLPKSKHRGIPRINGRENNIRHLQTIRPLATEWHKSPEGRAWHRQHAITTLHKADSPKPWSLSPISSGRCMWCGNEMQVKIAERKLFCSNSCLWQESGMRRGKYQFVHPNYDPSRRIKSA